MAETELREKESMKRRLEQAESRYENREEKTERQKYSRKTGAEMQRRSENTGNLKPNLGD